jgi:hypothetical protein
LQAFFYFLFKLSIFCHCSSNCVQYKLI